VLAVAVSFSASFAIRALSNYIQLRDQYQAAVGIAQPKLAVKSTPGSSRYPNWILVYFGYIILTSILKALHPPLEFTAHVLIFAGIGLFFIRKALSIYRTLRAHPELDLRLRLIPLIHIAIWGLVAFAFFAIVHILVVVDPPAQFLSRSK
jgi:hypothetical protein